MVTINLDGKLYEIVKEENHPKDDPDFPSYQSEEYQEINKDIDFVDDMVGGNILWIFPNGRVNHVKLRSYLPSHEGEHRVDYRIRYTHTPWYDLFKQVLSRLPGYLSQVSYTDFIYQGLKQYWGNCDKQGSSLPTFFLDADYRVLKDQVCFILVDFPDTENFLFSPNQIAESRPFLKLIDRKDLINFICDETGKLTKIVIREAIEIAEGAYGKSHYTQYREFNEDGSYKVSVVIKEKKKQQTLTRTGEPKLLLYTIKEGKNSIGEIPLVIYSFDRISPLTAKPIFYNLAKLQLNHYELCSQDYMALRQSNFPIYVREGIRQVGQKSDIEDYKVLAPNRMQDIPSGAKFYVVEPSTEWAEVNKSRLEKIEAEFSKQENQFLGQNSGTKTATQSKFEASSRNANILILALRKLQALNQIEYFWAKYYGINVDLSDDTSNFRIDLSALGFTNQETTDRPSTVASEDTTAIIGE